MSRAVAKDTLIFSGSTAIVLNISFLLAIFVRGALGPELMGVWALMQVVLKYASYTNAGMISAVCREIPVLRGRGAQEAEIQNYRNSGHVYLSLIAVVTSCVLVIAAFVLRESIQAVVFYGLLAVALITFLERSNNYLVQLLYADKRFGLTSKFKLYSALVNAGLVFALTWQFGLYGFFVAMVLSLIFNIAYLYAASGLRFKFQVDWVRIKSLFGFGVPLWILGLVNTLFQTADKILIAKFLGLKALGIYSIALMGGAYMYMLPNVFQIVLLPRTLEKFGNHLDKTGRVKHSILPGRIMVIYCALFAGLLWIGAPFLCAWLLPKYVAGIPALQALVVAYCFISLSQQMSHILLGYRKHVWLIPEILMLSIAYFAVSALALSNGAGLLEIAILMSVFQLLHYLIASWLALRRVMRLGAVAVEIALNVLPIMCAVGVLLLLDQLWPGVSFTTTCLKAALFAAFWLLQVVLLEERTHVLRNFKEIVLARIASQRARVSVEVK